MDEQNGGEMGRGLDLNAGHKVRQLNHDQHFDQKKMMASGTTKKSPYVKSPNKKGCRQKSIPKGDVRAI